MNYITAEINDVDSMIENMISSNPDYENAIQLLCIIPGAKRDSAITIISKVVYFRQLIEVRHFLAILYFLSRYYSVV